jgi:hypothetical protein
MDPQIETSLVLIDHIRIYPLTICSFNAVTFQKLPPGTPVIAQETHENKTQYDSNWLFGLEPVNFKLRAGTSFRPDAYRNTNKYCNAYMDPKAYANLHTNSDLDCHTHAHSNDHVYCHANIDADSIHELQLVGCFASSRC